MKRLTLANGTWVVVCDGQKAIVLENVGDEPYPDLRVRNTETREAPRTADLGADRPGRVHQRFGEARSAIEQTDWHLQEEEAFLKQLLSRLDRAVQGKETTGLVIVAPPRALGVLRKAYSKSLRRAIIAEIDKDLTSVPADELEERLVGKRK